MRVPAYAAHIPKQALVRLWCDGCGRPGSGECLAVLVRDEGAKERQSPEWPFYGHFADCLKCGHRNALTKSKKARASEESRGP